MAALLGRTRPAGQVGNRAGRANSAFAAPRRVVIRPVAATTVVDAAIKEKPRLSYVGVLAASAWCIA